MSDSSPTALSILEALALSTQGAQRVGQVVGQLQSNPGLYPLRRLRPLFVAMPLDVAALPSVQALRAAVVEALRLALAQPEPGADDHSLVDIEWACHCVDCRPVIDWAASPSRQVLTLAIAEARRDHVQNQLKAAAAPLYAETIKKGSPYKLQLGKPDDLSARRRAQRQAWAADLAALEACKA